MAPNFWWVNQGQRYELEKNFLSAPKQDKRGYKLKHYTAVKYVKIGDIIFHYVKGKIQVVSIATSEPYDYTDHNESVSLKKEKRRVDLKSTKIDPIPIKRIKPYLREINETIEDNTPLNKKGGGKQGYLFNFSLPAAQKIREIYNKPFPEEIENIFKSTPLESVTDDYKNMDHDKTIHLIQKKEVKNIIEINDEIIKLWEDKEDVIPKTYDKKYEDELSIKGKLLYPYIYPENIERDKTMLFVGVNPSFVPKDNMKVFTKYKGFIQEKLPNIKDEDLSPFILYDWEKRDSSTRKKVLVTEEIMRQHYTYFKVFNVIADENSLKPVHIDMFSIRITNQKEIETELFKKAKKNEELKAFVDKEYEIFLDVIKYINPKAIIIINAFLSKYFEVKKDDKYTHGEFWEIFQTQWEENLGYHTVKINNKRIPMFLTSMLSGQRALDVGSLRRLRWQIKNSLNQP